MRIPRHGSIESKSRVAAYDHIGPTGGSQRQILIVLWIVALPHSFSRLDPLSRNDDNVENPLAPLNGDEAVELRAEDNLTVLVLDLLRQDKPVGWIDGAQQGALREAVCFEGSGDEGRGVDDDDQARRSARHSSSSASISSSVRPCVRASRLASAIASARTSRARPPFSRLLR